MLNEYKNISLVVEETLRDYPQTRGSDKRLILEVWQKEGLILSQEQEDFISAMCSSPESITRVRRKVNEGGLYRPTRDIEYQRKAEEEKVRNHFAGKRELF